MSANGMSTSATRSAPARCSRCSTRPRSTSNCSPPAPTSQTAQANQQLAASTAARWQNMLAKDAVSKQETDEKVGDLAAKSAVSNAARANVDRLQFTQGFTRLIAPFGGTVTSRSTDIGALVSAGTAASTPLFTVVRRQPDARLRAGAAVLFGTGPSWHARRADAARICRPHVRCGADPQRRRGRSAHRARC